jgi:hypothetical protein
MTQTKKIEAYNLGDFVKGIQESAKEGFEIDFNSNESYPISMVGYYRCIMYKGPKLAALLKEKAPETLVQEGVTEPTPEVKEEPKQDFKPSVVFVAEEPTKAQKPRGRPVSRGV